MRVLEGCKSDAIAGFKDVRGPWAKECLQSLEAKEDKEMESPLELPETTLFLVWRDSFQVSDPRTIR